MLADVFYLTLFCAACSMKMKLFLFIQFYIEVILILVWIFSMEKDASFLYNTLNYWRFLHSIVLIFWICSASKLVLPINILIFFLLQLFKVNQLNRFFIRSFNAKLNEMHNFPLHNVQCRWIYEGNSARFKKCVWRFCAKYLLFATWEYHCARFCCRLFPLQWTHTLCLTVANAFFCWQWL